jgi:hypothetical protein
MTTPLDLKQNAEKNFIVRFTVKTIRLGAIEADRCRKGRGVSAAMQRGSHSINRSVVFVNVQVSATAGEMWS